MLINNCLVINEGKKFKQFIFMKIKLQQKRKSAQINQSEIGKSPDIRK